MSFAAFRDAVAQRFETMSKSSLFCVSVEKDTMWDTYLGSFPEGSNLLFRKRTQHDCSCCRAFIKVVGNAVAISETGKISTIWDVKLDDPVYQTVADAMANLIRSNTLSNIFLHYQENVGTRQNYEHDNGKSITWDHFHVKLPVRRNTGKNIVVPKDQIGTLKGSAHARYDVFNGGLEKITIDALDTVLELIGQNSLYRGQENKSAVEQFRKFKKQYLALPEELCDNFAWSHAHDGDLAATQIKNTSIGTLLINLSEGDDLEAAVGRYEAMVAPINYRRSTALVTKAQIDKAKAKIEELGLTSALSRRYAYLTDIKATNVLFADRSVRKNMKGGDVFDSLPTKKKTTLPKMNKIEEISIESFLADILPQVTTVELMFENRHARNLMSLIAPADSTAANLFKWDNQFSWTYTGDATDSVKERVKKAGGNVTGELCCRLAWYNYDDLDFWMTEPQGKSISFMNKTSQISGGVLDVDMNAGSGSTRTPVENIYYQSIARMPSGNYFLAVNQYYQRETVDVGFEVEIDHLGTVINMVYDKVVRGKIRVAEITKDANGLTIKPLLKSSLSNASKTIWGLNTMEFHRVNSIMLSPNYWDNQEGGEQSGGAKHYFFMLDECVNDGEARGFYNEFLRSDLHQHRKVLEMVGAKMKTEQSKDQLSGLGFIATARNDIVVRVSGANMTRAFKVKF